MNAGVPGRTLLEILAARSAAAPASVAVRDDDRVLTHGELASRSDGVARAVVRHLGVGSEPVGVLVPTGVDAIVAILGVIKAGKVVLPLDDGAPAAEVEQALAHAGARLVVTDDAGRVLSPAVEALELGPLDGAPGGPVDLPAVDPADPAVLFTTSGSTGSAEGLRHPARCPGPGRGLVDHAVPADARRPRRDVLPPQLRCIAREHVRRAGERCRAAGVRAPAGRHRSARGGDRCRRDHRRAHERVAAALPVGPASGGRELPDVAAARSGCGGHARTRHRALPSPRRTDVHARLHVRHVGDRPGERALRGRGDAARRRAAAGGVTLPGQTGAGSSVRMRTASGRS